ncbi:hypothetical protein CLAFUW4_10073 [Fulvia fulva]|uniref:Uncharacterized protein n=1 Tax=Passalora fulva TaxID=5499 RepID=A0A9Q8PHT5_PASFU|nr:uncharacterized protein CLAFUR5_12172 [Fulvia fulva]KAK4615643.1 hypothetical protein CLAFUR4_10077 [Fulvia fulva]KAK4616433.1 hypothetical protein CLAFUR0_10075 [Fulvia fulva]UJO22776.1 hypothetical protein CLAFUR5_12172 [Fulvia fulva]WPV19398.1 hypothetical protein CLAFUW4_10073 [Fulvia fulva]WPV34186.1 hypothetical protein CLAFUW7_10074 [Fulvia fulva]
MPEYDSWIPKDELPSTFEEHMHRAMNRIIIFAQEAYHNSLPESRPIRAMATPQITTTSTAVALEALIMQGDDVPATTIANIVNELRKNLVLRNEAEYRAIACVMYKENTTCETREALHNKLWHTYSLELSKRIHEVIKAGDEGSLDDEREEVERSRSREMGAYFSFVLGLQE